MVGAPEKVGEWQGHCRRFFLAAAWIGESLEADDGAWDGVGTVKTEEDAIVELEASVFGGDWMWRDVRELLRLASRFLGGCRPWRRAASATPVETSGGQGSPQPW